MTICYKKGDADTRPWGKWEVLETGEHFCVKKITVNPQAILSLQLHHHRAEHWVITQGNALVTLGDEVLKRGTSSSVFIPQETKHRIQNASDIDNLIFIEVQTGETLDENDIVRFDDAYGRVK